MQIKKNVPIPAPKVRKSNWSKWPFCKMEVGDSVDIPHEGKRSLCNASTAARVHGSKTGKKFVFRYDEIPGHVSIWRTR